MSANQEFEIYFIYCTLNAQKFLTFSYLRYVTFDCNNNISIQMIFCIIIFLNSISDRFFFASSIMATSLPTIYLWLGSL